MLAGLPPQAGLYASIAPLLVYGVLGSSRVLAVGPVAVVSLMTATAIGDLAAIGSARISSTRVRNEATDWVFIRATSRKSRLHMQPGRMLSQGAPPLACPYLPVNRTRRACSVRSAGRS